MRQELASRNRARMRRVRAVHQVRHLTLQKLTILLPHRELHQPLIHLLTHHLQQRQLVLRTLLHRGNAKRRNRPHRRTGQRRSVDNHPRAVILRTICNGVSQQQAALGIRIPHLHSRPVIHRQHIVTRIRVPARTAVRQRQQRHQVHRQPVVGSGKQHTRHRRRPGHITLHLLHIVTGLDIQSTRVIHHTLANQHNRILLIIQITRTILQHHKPRLVHTAAVHRQQAAHPQTLNLLLVHHRALHTRQILRNALQLLRKLRRIQILHRQVHPLAAPENTVPQALRLLQLTGLEKALVHHNLRQVVTLLRHITVKTVVRQRQTLEHRGHLLRQHARTRHSQAPRLLLLQHPQHLRSLPPQQLVHPRRCLLAVERNHIQMIRQTVEHLHKTAVLLPTPLHNRRLRARQRQLALSHLVTIQKKQSTLVLACIYLL